MRYAHVDLLRNVLEGLSILASPDAIPKTALNVAHHDCFIIVVRYASAIQIRQLTSTSQAAFTTYPDQLDS
jgi:hypothetical protein